MVEPAFAAIAEANSWRWMETQFSKQEIAWRHEVERLFALYEDHWAVGCTAYLTLGLPQKRCTDVPLEA